jgi:hypothetical protein
MTRDPLLRRLVWLGLAAMVIGLGGLVILWAWP